MSPPVGGLDSLRPVLRWQVPQNSDNYSSNGDNGLKYN